jgi:hypothetical protein
VVAAHGTLFAVFASSVCLGEFVESFLKDGGALMRTSRRIACCFGAAASGYENFRAKKTA